MQPPPTFPPGAIRLIDATLSATLSLPSLDAERLTEVRQAM